MIQLLHSLRAGAFPLVRACFALTLVLFLHASALGQCSDMLACNYDPSAEPNDYDLQLELVQEDIGQLVGTTGTVDLTGYSTWRVYFYTPNPEDFVSSVSGDAENPTTLTTSTSFYHAPIGGSTPNAINPVLFPFYPELFHDSWVTIGIDGVPNPALGEATVSTVQSDINPWLNNFDPGEGQPGASIVIDDAVGGAWYTLAGDANGEPDETGRVLLGQFTTDGVLGGQLQIQVFPNGDGDNFVVWEAPVGQTYDPCLYLQTYYVDNDGDGYGTDPVELCGWEEGYAESPGDCNDNSAIAYPGNPMDIVGDGIDGDCDGAETCYRDVDNDGYRSESETDLIGSPFNVNCSEFGEAYVYEPLDCDDANPSLTEADENGNCIVPVTEVLGCGNPAACNFDPEVDPAEDNCEFLTCQGCGNQSACNYDADAQIFNEALCEYLTCAGCTDPEATNYNSSAVISLDSDCIYSAILAIAPVMIDFGGEGGVSMGTYTNEVFALLPPDAIQLNQVIGIKDGDIRLRLSPYDALYQSMTCVGWTPGLGQAPFLEVDGETYTNMECFKDSWFTIGGDLSGGPALQPLGFDPLTVEEAGQFDSELLSNSGDTLGWALLDENQGIPGDYCEVLGGRPGCAQAVRLARLTLPLGTPFSMEAGLTYTVGSTGGRVSVDGILETSGAEVQSDGGGGGEADEEDTLIVDGGTSNVVNGCLDATACNFNPNATSDSGDCDYQSCVGCTYPEASNFDASKTTDDGSCLFSGCTDPGFLEFDANANDDNGTCSTLVVFGCTDPAYIDFNPNANTENPSDCLTLALPGCTYPDAFNYTALANVEDGSCLYGGCTDPAYFNFDDGADVDDGSCSELIVTGCTDPAFVEFDANANVLDPTACLTGVVLGCTYAEAENFAPIANTENGTCTFGFVTSVCEGDLNGDGAIGAADLLDFLSVFDTTCD